MEAATTNGRANASVDVDPVLLEAIGSAGAPKAAPRAPRPSSDLPGTLSAYESARGLIGNLTRGMAYVTECRERFGDIYRAPFIHLPMVVVWNADEVHRILRNDENVWSTAMGWSTFMFDGLEDRAGNMGTLLSLDFDDHRVARKLVQPAFTLRALEGYLAIADKWFAQAVSSWTASGSVAFKPAVRSLLANAAGEIFTGIRDPERVAVVDRALSDFWHGMMAVSKNRWISPTFRRSRRGLKTLLKTFLALVPERRKSDGEDLFSHMCRITDTDGLDDEAIVRVFITIMFGAFDTTSAALTSMAYLLAKNPEWQERLREEALAASTTRPDVNAMKGMRQHEWVWKETLRLMPVAGFIPRRALRDVVVGGYSIAAGTLVMPMNGGLGHHPKWFPDPLRFDPARFSPERAEDRQHPGIFNPFGAGAHACVGMQLANLEMKLLWHRILTSCRFRLTQDYVARHTFTPMGSVSGDVALTLEPLA